MAEPTKTIHVHEINQAAGGGSYVCIFDALVTLRPSGPIDVVVTGVEPPESDVELIASAAESIRSGALEVLQPKGIAASIRVTRLLVHPVDFKETRFRLYTAREIRRLLDTA